MLQASVALTLRHCDREGVSPFTSLTTGGSEAAGMGVPGRRCVGVSLRVASDGESWPLSPPHSAVMVSPW